MKNDGRLTFLAPIAVLLVQAISFIVVLPLMFMPQGEIFDVVLQLNFQIVAIALPCLLIATLTREDMQQTFRFRKISPLAAVLCGFIGIGAMFAFNYINAYFIFLVEPLVGKITIPDLTQGGIVSQIGMTVGAVVFAPLSEELLFRGYVQSKYNAHSTISSIILSAVLFGLFHMTVYQVFYAFCMGVVLGLISHWTGSIWGGIIAHAAANLGSMLLSFFKVDVSFEVYTILSIVALLLTAGLMTALFFVTRNCGCKFNRGKIGSAAVWTTVASCVIMALFTVFAAVEI